MGGSVSEDLGEGISGGWELTPHPPRFLNGNSTKDAAMPYISGVLTGILVTVIVVFLVDHIDDAPGSPDIVNWSVVASQLGGSVEKAGEKLRQEVHEATEPDTLDTTATTAKPTQVQ